MTARTVRAQRNRRVAALSFSMAIACAAPPTRARPTSGTHDYVMTAVDVPTVVDGRVSGFDLDAVDGVTCGKPDARGTRCVDDNPNDTTEPVCAATTEVGIDNSFASAIAPLGAVLSNLQAVINRGGLVFLLRLAGVESFENDDTVTAELVMGRPIPSAPLQADTSRCNAGGTQCLIGGGNTFAIDPISIDATGRARTRFDDASIRNGELQAGPGPIHLRLSFGIGEPFDVSLSLGRIRVSGLRSEGFVDATLGGRARIADVRDGVDRAMPGLGMVITDVLGPAADMPGEGTGTCDSISAAFDLRGVSTTVVAF